MMIREDHVGELELHPVKFRGRNPRSGWGLRLRNPRSPRRYLYMDLKTPNYLWAANSRFLGDCVTSNPDHAREVLEELRRRAFRARLCDRSFLA